MKIFKVNDQHDIARDREMFLNRLNWKANSGEWKELNSFQVDIYKFTFIEPVTGSAMTEFVDFLKDLDMKYVRSVMILWIWFYQHGIKFKLSFGYSERRSLWNNVRHYFIPMKVDQKMRAAGHNDIMACSLKEIKDQYKREEN